MVTKLLDFVAPSKLIQFFNNTVHIMRSANRRHRSQSFTNDSRFLSVLSDFLQFLGAAHFVDGSPLFAKERMLSVFSETLP
jgi:hypothetical protein